MSDTVFTKVDYTLNSLVNNIEMGVIGLPDIQRPFIWKNAKVRDLFDSMYRGYPIGYLLLWRNGLASDRTIGTDVKQKTPQLVIVDGQQRLTSLYAVVKGVPVVRGNYKTECIHISFNPLEERFEVYDAAIERDKAYISDISKIWETGTNIFKVADEYLKGLKSAREVSEEEVEKIQNSVTKLQALTSFPFTALELAPDISEEDVSDVFVRINSAGASLNQADFILTLMSVFWDEGRAELEKFCRDARQPSKGTPSPYNYFIEPEPSQLLRVCVGVAFKRARLQYVYSILRGKDLETEQFSDERRVEQFEKLKDAQSRVLNIQYWQDFLSCIRLAGFRSGKMISSQNNLLFAYMLYLIGRTEVGVDEFTLRRIIAQWFFMAAVTGRFTGSPESAMESDLARLRDMVTPDKFVNRLRQICEISLTNDFWSVTLPNDLATSSPRSPSLFAYNAALVLLDVRALFSNSKVGDMLDPAIQANRSPVERHHLYPKGYLNAQNITDTRIINQIANYAYVEWADNTKISDQPPAEYLPELKDRFSESELAEMYHYHALPEKWEHLEYNTFLEQRRELMAKIIQEGYRRLVAGRDEIKQEKFDLSVLIDNGESEAVEFKSTLRTNLHTGSPDQRIELAALKTLAGFLNTNGGTLVIGISDDGSPVGLEADNFPNEDKMSLHLVNIVKSRISPQTPTLMNMHFEDHEGERVMVIRCRKSSSPVFVKDNEHERFYVRTGPSTTELKASQTHEYIKDRFKK
ncbi:hypothetical protein J2128_000080 [Methanomicrobium sp. W14]|uniref:GmrSD restriction endonuclease domain-containing protein n=1 Tax=Methanomicrobium sp. W14 TaxID=2817839 RepID=UPI001AE8E253|nr:DUF262 domain-containing protein [Methanomicrobium sp. W14]MBP2132159.1 hypothetical protein [Methanomicrobium sp. W14]